MGKPHVLVIPYPVQGHVNPLMDFSRYLAKSGIRITFVNTELSHKRILHARANKNTDDSLLGDDQIHLVSIQDGLTSDEDGNDLVKLCDVILRDMPAKLEELILGINEFEADGGKITCVLADGIMSWALEVAHKVGVKGAFFWPASASVFAITKSIPQLINNGLIDNDGLPIKRQMFQLSPSTPAMDTTNIPWACLLDLAASKFVFKYVRRCMQALGIADWWLCNTTYELEPAAFSLFPKLKPIGPLMASHHIGNSGAQFWTEDLTCLNWLQQQPVRSVIYVAFGSFTIMDQTQFHELAHALELLDRPFIWVVRPGTTDGPSHSYPDGFKGTRGKIVSWAPQQKVLSHPAIACFLSHCGWNSTIEGISNGVPFLCWPYFTDQLFNQDYICDVWRIGLRFERDEKGIITRREVQEKAEQLLGDEFITARSLELKEMAISNVAEAGPSSKNFNDFIQWL